MAEKRQNWAEITQSRLFKARRVVRPQLEKKIAIVKVIDIRTYFESNINYFF